MGRSTSPVKQSINNSIGVINVVCSVHLNRPLLKFVCMVGLVWVLIIFVWVISTSHFILLLSLALTIPVLESLYSSRIYIHKRKTQVLIHSQIGLVFVTISNKIPDTISRLELII